MTRPSERAMGLAAKKKPLMIDDYDALLIHKFMEWLVVPMQRQFIDRYTNFTDQERNSARRILIALEERQNA